MGSWDVGSFDNDTAADWALGLDAGGIAYIEDALEQALVVNPDASLGAEEGECALAAAEVVARWRGKAGTTSAYSAPADAWVEAQTESPSADLVARARAAVERIAGEHSELAELWGESGEDGAWHDELIQLRERLT